MDLMAMWWLPVILSVTSRYGGWIQVKSRIQPESDIWFQPVISLTFLDDSLISSDGDTVRVLSETSGEELNSFRIVMPEKLF